MECHFGRGFLRLHSIQARARCFTLTDFSSTKVLPSSFEVNEKRLYHPGKWGTNHTSYFHPTRFLSSPVLCGKRIPISSSQHSRTIIISKVIGTLSEAELTSIEGLSKFIIESYPVNAVKSLYEWTEAATGLPWGANILVCSFLLQLLFNVPANIYMGRWLTGKEKHVGDMVAIKSTVMRTPSRENIKLYGKMFNDLSHQYGCQRYKLFTAVAYQLVYVTITSFGVRALLLDPQLDLKNAMLPWGTLLGFPDLLLPIINVSLSLLLVEVGAWKKLRSEDGLKMTFKRAGVPYQSEPLYLLNLRRFCILPFILIYTVVPSAMTLHWFVMMVSSVNVQILLAHRQTRRTMGIAPCYYETNNPYKDFLLYLRNDVTVRQRKS